MTTHTDTILSEIDTVTMLRKHANTLERRVDALRFYLTHLHNTQHYDSMCLMVDGLDGQAKHLRTLADALSMLAQR